MSNLKKSIMIFAVISLGLELGLAGTRERYIYILLDFLIVAIVMLNIGEYFANILVIQCFVLCRKVRVRVGGLGVWARIWVKESEF